MKRFKDISNLSDINIGDKVNTLSPKAVYSQAAGRGGRGARPTPAPPAPPAPTKGIDLPENFKSRLKDAIAVTQGKFQLDEYLGLGASGALLVGGQSIMNNLTKMNFLGSDWSKLGHFVSVAALANLVGTSLKAPLRALINVNIGGLPELKYIKTMKYPIKVYDAVEIPGTKSTQAGGSPSTKNMTLIEIAELLSQAEGEISDQWYVKQGTGGKYYMFADPDDVSRIAHMLDRNDTSNKIDAWITGLLPFTAAGGTLAFIQTGINNARAAYKKAGDEVSNDPNSAMMKSTPQQRSLSDAEKRKYIQEQNLKHKN